MATDWVSNKDLLEWPEYDGYYVIFIEEKKDIH